MSDTSKLSKTKPKKPNTSKIFYIIDILSIAGNKLLRGFTIYKICFCFLCIFKNHNMHISASLLEYKILREKLDVFWFLPPQILDEV